MGCCGAVLLLYLGSAPAPQYLLPVFHPRLGRTEMVLATLPHLQPLEDFLQSGFIAFSQSKLNKET